MDATAVIITIHTGKNTQKIIKGETSALAMHFADGEVLETDMIVFSAGVRPDDKLAREQKVATEWLDARIEHSE